MATLLRKVHDFDRQDDDQGSSPSFTDKMLRMTRLIEALQHLAENLPAAELITEQDRVLLANFLNEGATPWYAAEQVCRTRDRLH